MDTFIAPGVETERGRGIRTSYSGDNLYYLNSNKVVKINLKTHESWIFPVQNLKLTAIEYHLPGKFFAGDDSGSLVYYNEQDSSLIVQKALNGQVNCIKIVGNLLIVAGAGLKFQLKTFDLDAFLKTNSLEEIFKIHTSPWQITCMTVLEDGMFAFGKEDGTLNVYDSEGKAVLNQLVDKSAINDIYFDPHHDMIYYGTLSRTLGAYSMEERKIVHVEKNMFGGAVYGIKCLSDSKYILTCSSDSTIRLWKVTEKGTDLLYAMDLSNELQKPDVVVGMHVTQSNQAIAFTLHNNQLLLNPIGTNSTIGVQKVSAHHKSSVLAAFELEKDKFVTMDLEGKITQLSSDGICLTQLWHLSKALVAVTLFEGNLIYATHNSIGMINLLDLEAPQSELVKVAQGIKKVLMLEDNILVIAEKSVTLCDKNLKITQDTKLTVEICSGIVAGNLILCGDKTGNMIVFDSTLHQVSKNPICPGAKLTTLHLDRQREMVIAASSNGQLLFMNSNTLMVYLSGLQNHLHHTQRSHSRYSHF